MGVDFFDRTATGGVQGLRTRNGGGLPRRPGQLEARGVRAKRSGSKHCRAQAGLWRTGRSTGMPVICGVGVQQVKRFQRFQPQGQSPPIGDVGGILGGRPRLLQLICPVPKADVRGR